MIAATFLRRYKRFLADFRLPSGEEVTAHCPNTGAMLGVLIPGALSWLSYNPSPSRKLAYTWEAVYVEGTIVGLNTMAPNRLVADAFANKQIPFAVPYHKIRREVTYGEHNSRIDFLLSMDTGERCYVEVKNIHLKRGNCAFFPDTVTERGARHLRELQKMVVQGHRSIVLYIAQRNDVDCFGVAEDLDPVYGQVAREAQKNGVEMMAYRCRFSSPDHPSDHPLDISSDISSDHPSNLQAHLQGFSEDLGRCSEAFLRDYFAESVSPTRPLKLHLDAPIPQTV